MRVLVWYVQILFSIVFGARSGRGSRTSSVGRPPPDARHGK